MEPVRSANATAGSMSTGLHWGEDRLTCALGHRSTLWRQRLQSSHKHGRDAIGCRAVPELTVPIAAPTVHTTVL